MFRLKEGQSLKLQIVVYTAGLLLLTQNSAGQYDVLSSPQQIFTTTDSDIILPCHLVPSVDAVSMAVEWTRLDLYPRFVHVRQGGQDLLVDQNPKYEGRTSLSINKLKLGDVSLKLSKVKLSDAGTYKCFIPGINKHSVVHLVVDDVFMTRSYSAVHVISAFFFGLLLPSAIFLLVFIFRKLRQKRGNNKMRCEKETSKEGGEEERLIGSETTKDPVREESHGKEEEKKDLQYVISVVEEQKTELGKSRAENEAKLEMVEKEWAENEKKLQTVKGKYHWDKCDKKNRLLESKIELENKKTEFKKSLESTEKSLQKTMEMISILEKTKTKLEILREQNSKQKKELEEERGESKMKPQKVKDRFQRNKPEKMNPRSEVSIEQENEKTEHLEPLDSTEENVQGTMDMISVLGEQKTEKQKSKQKKVDKEKGQSKIKLQKVKTIFQRSKPDKMNSVLESKIETENQKTEPNKPLDSVEKNIQESMDTISVLEEQKTEPENTRVEQKSKQKKVEKEKGESKMKLPKVMDRFKQNKSEKKNPDSEIQIEMENKKTED